MAFSGAFGADLGRFSLALVARKGEILHDGPLDAREGDRRDDHLHFRPVWRCIGRQRSGQSGIGGVSQQAVAMAADPPITSAGTSPPNILED